MLKNTSSTYGSISKIFHWLIFSLVLIIIPLGYFMGDVSDKALRGEVINLHKLLGLSILAIVVLRLLWMLINIKPKSNVDAPIWQRWAEKIVHYGLYICLFVMPLSGYIGSLSAGRAPHLGSFSLQMPLAKRESWAEFLFESIHEPLAVIFIALITVHILAALYHHFIAKDNVLRRMLFGRGSQ